ncbi:hypothetical protein [Streptomyces griseorubiginosus]|uniref:hypothetical protein n=1 Tax=Streptomyces griseorubiginosus TaxID=67304 RepID=UPI001AD6C216|nr:hypothetical protein [Streptomyces griseorubiginosus]MBO4254978.1 hypothetical protein [Streptomyces griseorubiginosus]
MTTVTAPTALAEEVEHHLGDPYDTTSPTGFRAILAASETGRSTVGEPLPAALTRSGNTPPEAWLHALRALYRRSPHLARPVRPGLPDAGMQAAAVRIGAAVGALDSALRVTVRHLRGRHLYGAAAVDIPRLREVLSGVHADLLLCDVLTTLAVRDEDPLPAHEGVHEQAVRHLVPRVIQSALDRLSVLMGSRFYIRAGEHAVFQMLLHQTQRELFATDRPPSPAPRRLPFTELVTAPRAAALLAPEFMTAAPGGILATHARRVRQPSGAVQERLYGDLIRRYDNGRSFDLAERRLPDRP